MTDHASLDNQVRMDPMTEG